MEDESDPSRHHESAGSSNDRCMATVDGDLKESAQEKQKKLNDYLAYIHQLGEKYIGRNEVLHLKLNNAYKQDRVKIEAMVIPGTPSCLIWTETILPLFVGHGGSRQTGVEPKGDLERRVQQWLDKVTRP